MPENCGQYEQMAWFQRLIDTINGVDNGDVKLLTNIIHIGLGLSTELLTA
ncbi:MAG: hypothetical protein N4A40_03970 [Tissierellales bacterium]|jgi:hypothetical protein|nr:hypothetical protein [Tissierellales bacterium]